MVPQFTLRKWHSCIISITCKKCFCVFGTSLVKFSNIWSWVTVWMLKQSFSKLTYMLYENYAVSACLLDKHFLNSASIEKEVRNRLDSAFELKIFGNMISNFSSVFSFSYLKSQAILFLSFSFFNYWFLFPLLTEISATHAMHWNNEMACDLWLCFMLRYSSAGCFTLGAVY